MKERGVLRIYGSYRKKSIDHDGIGERQEDGRPVTIIDVKEIVDQAIRKSEKIGFRKLSMVLSRKRYDQDDRVILYEKDFR